MSKIGRHSMGPLAENAYNISYLCLLVTEKYVIKVTFQVDGWTQPTQVISLFFEEEV